MSSKTSLSNINNGALFNKAFYKVNVKRFGFVFILYFLISEVLIDLFYMKVIGSEVWSYAVNPMRSKYVFIDQIGYYYFFSIFFLAFVMSLVLFNYVDNEKALTSLHAMPVSRKSLYFTNFAVFTSMTGLTLFVHFVLLTIHISLKGYVLGEFIGYMILKYIVVMVLALAVFAFTTFIGMLVSNFIIQAGLVFVFLGMPALIVQLFQPIVGVLLNGYTTYLNQISWDVDTMPYYFLFRMMKFFDYGEVDSYAGLDPLSFSLAIILLVLSFVFGYILYQKRDLEKCHDLIAFKWAKKIITVLISIIIALIFANIVGVIGSITNTYKPALFYVGACVGMFLGYVIMKMISEKSLSMHKFLLGGIISAAIALTTLFVIDLDIIGYEKYTPELEDVDLAYVYTGINWIDAENIEKEYGFVEDSYSGYGINENRVVKINGKEDLNKFIDKHLDVADKAKEEKIAYKNFYIMYVLKNGKTVMRAYGLDDETYDEYMNYLKGLESNRKNLSEDFNKEILSRDYVEGYASASGTGMVFMSAYDIKEFLKVYKQDLIDFMTNNNKLAFGSSSYIEYEQLESVVHLSLVAEGSETKRYEYLVAKSFERSIAWLKENGYGELFGEEVKKVEIGNKKSSVFKPKVIDIYKIEGDGDQREVCTFYDEFIITKFLRNFEELSDNVVEKLDGEGFIIVYHNQDGSVKQVLLDEKADYMIWDVIDSAMSSDEFER